MLICQQRRHSSESILQNKLDLWLLCTLSRCITMEEEFKNYLVDDKGRRERVVHTDEVIFILVCQED